MKHYCVTPEQIEAILIMFHSGNYYIKEIALKFGISLTTVNTIIKEEKENGNTKISE